MTGSEILLIAIQAFGGVALFIYGMSMLGSGLEKISGGRLEKILSNLTSNVFKSVCLGALVTAAVQSSGATTVIIVGMVNAGILKLSSAIGVIMGANIGTTVTGQILRLAGLDNSADTNIFLRLLSPRYLAPIISIIGLIIFMLSKNSVRKSLGETLVGLGILFTGMLSMTDSVGPLAELEAFRRLFETLSNPILGVIAGAVVTALLQSSSASVGILQSIAGAGNALKFSAAFPIIMGQNIGTCVTSIISASGASKNAKRAAVVHLYFNVIGTIIFLAAVYGIKAVWGFPFWNDPIDMGGIANFHTLFNISVTVLFLPFTSVLEKLACITIRDSDEGEAGSSGIEEITVKVLDERLLKSPSLAIQQAHNTVITMGRLSLQNFTGMRKLFGEEYSEKIITRLKSNENAIDHMEDKLNAYLVRLSECGLTDYENRRVTELLHLTSEFERIGDYAMNLIENAEKLHDMEVSFSEDALKELSVISDAVEEIIGMSVDAVKGNDVAIATKIEPLEETVDYLNEVLKARHIERLKDGKCVVESGVNFLDLLVNLERISDHCSNIGVYVIGAQKSRKVMNRHEYIQSRHEGSDSDYAVLTEQYMAKYNV